MSDSGILRVWQLEKDYLIMKEQNSSMAVEIEKLQAELELLESRPELLEEVAREKLQMARPGEEIYLFPTEPENK